MGGAEKGCGVGVGETVPGVNGQAPVPSLRGNLQAFGRNDRQVGRTQEGSQQPGLLGGGPPLSSLELSSRRQPRAAAWVSVSGLSSRLVYEP